MDNMSNLVINSKGELITKFFTAKPIGGVAQYGQLLILTSFI